MRKEITILPALFLILAVIFFTAYRLPLTASAQTSDFELAITPPLTHIIIKPGNTTSTRIKVENNGNYDVNVTPVFVDFKSDDRTGNPVLMDTMSFDYIFLEDTEVSLDKPFLFSKGSSKELAFSINIPEGAPDKEQYFSLLFKAEPLQDTLLQSSQTSVQGTVATNFIVTTTKSAQDKGNIELYSFEAPLFLDSLLSFVTSTILVKNTGQNMTVTLGKIEVFNMFKKLVYEQEIMPENVLPSSTREIKVAKVAIFNEQEVKEPTSFKFKPPFLLGPYSIRLTYSSPNQPEKTYEHKLYALPVSVLIIFIIGYCLYLLYIKTRFFMLDRSNQKVKT